MSCCVQLKLGSAGVSMALMFLMDLEVLWLRVDLSSRFLSAQVALLYGCVGRSISIDYKAPISTHPFILPYQSYIQ